MVETVELVCKRLHMPYPNVRIPANMRVAIGPPELAEALCVRGFFEKVSEDVLRREREAEEAQIAAQKAKAESEAPKKEKPKAGSK
jgi:hypothetical protein